jgi:hypothetical protein
LPLPRFAILYQLYFFIVRGKFIKNITPFMAKIMRTFIADRSYAARSILEDDDDDDSLPSHRPRVSFEKLLSYAKPLKQQDSIVPHRNGHQLYSSFSRTWLASPKIAGLLLLRKNIVGLVPQHTRPGDALAILHGSKMPVLRNSSSPQIGDRDIFTLQGQAFVDGAMQGEAVKWEEEDADTFLLA